jgi:transcription elongation GreA/GreB family factor
MRDSRALLQYPSTLKKISNDLWQVKKASAQVTAPRADGTVAFGSSVVLSRNGREQRFRIVGADEADPAQGLISIRAPLAQAVIGARTGDVIEADAPLGEITIVSVGV